MDRLTRRGAIAGSLALSACTALPRATAAAAAGPGIGPWGGITPADADLDPARLDVAAAKLSERGERQGLVVVRHGRIAFERYWANDWHRASPEWRNVSFSSGKSWASTMVGVAVSEGKIGVDDLASRYHASEVSGLRPNTTLRHLLTMTSGGTRIVKPPSLRPPKLSEPPKPPGPPAEYRRAVTNEANPPPGYGDTLEPGTLFFYDGAASDHVSDVIAGAIGRGTHGYMMEKVVRPLGCENFAYQPEGIDHNDNVRVGGSILLSCRDMARLGQLYLNGGKWGGRRILDASYIRQATSPSTLNRHYGLLWWLNGDGYVPPAPRSMYYAAGARGQFCFVLPQHDMVVATMGFGEEQLSAAEAWTALQLILPTTR